MRDTPPCASILKSLRSMLTFSRSQMALGMQGLLGRCDYEPGGPADCFSPGHLLITKSAPLHLMKDLVVSFTQSPSPLEILLARLCLYAHSLVTY